MHFPWNTFADFQKLEILLLYLTKGDLLPYIDEEHQLWNMYTDSRKARVSECERISLCEGFRVPIHSL